MGKPDLPENHAGDYHLLEELGRGGGGTVYHGIHRKDGWEIALKIVHSINSSDKVVKQRFQAEIDTIASLKHPNIIPIYTQGDLYGRPFYSMKYFKGGNLETMRENFSSPKKAVELLIKVSRAVHYAHQHGILHQDLKPSNILLDQQGEPYVSDFGLSKHFHQEGSNTSTNTIEGTPSYMSPEQIQGDPSQITITSDIFNLGAILYYLLTGKHAFSGESSREIILKTLEDEVTFSSPQATFPIDHHLQSICLKCLRKASIERYPNALTFALALESWQIDNNVSQ